MGISELATLRAAGARRLDTRPEPVLGVPACAGSDPVVVAPLLSIEAYP